MKNAKHKYLPKEQREPKKAYEARLMRTSFNSFFRDAVIAFAGVLSRYELNNAPPTLFSALNNIDGQGNSLRSFLMKADALTLRDGGCLVMTDMPPPPEPGLTRADVPRRNPYLSLIDRRNLLSWSTTWENGVEVPASLVILEWHEEKIGDYGVQYVPRYRVIIGGEWKVFKLVGERGGLRAEVEINSSGNPMEGWFRGTNGDVLTRPPVQWYPGAGESFGNGELPLLPLANYALDHFREYSDLKELLHKTAMPVPVRIGAVGSGPNGTTPTWVLGPNSGVDIPTGGDFKFAEVVGSSLDKHEQHLIHIENLIDRKTLSFLFSGAQKTATQANLESVQMQATLQTVGEAKQSLVQSLMAIWCQFSGETLAADAGLELAEGIFDQPVTVEKITVAQDLYDNSLLSKKSVLYLEQKLGMLPPGKSIDDELKDIKAETPDPAPRPDVNDLQDGMPSDPQVAA